MILNSPLREGSRTPRLRTPPLYITAPTASLQLFRDVYSPGKLKQKMDNEYSSSLVGRLLSWLGLTLWVISILYFLDTIRLIHGMRSDLGNHASRGCSLPHPDPWDPSVLPYVQRATPLNCGKPFLRLDDEGLLHFPDHDASVSCSFRRVQRVDDDLHLTHSDWSSIDTFPADIHHELFEVKCINNTRQFFTDVYARILPRTVTTASYHDSTAPTSSHYSFITIGIDSMSHLNFVRTLPLTHAFLKNSTNAVTFTGYHKLGENTYPNLVPLLTGARVELRPGETSALPHGANKLFDDFPFFWNELGDEYVTLLAEDVPRINTFNFMKKGFLVPPTTHYMRPFYLALNEQLSSIKPLLNLLESRRVQLTSSSAECRHGRSLHSIMWQYAVKQTVRRYGATPKWIFSWLNELSHDDINRIGIVDEDLVELLQWLREEGALENTFVFLMSDHGNRYHSIRNTMVGRIEDRMPMLSVLLPERVDREHPELTRIFRDNSARLVTTTDLHATWRHIVKLASGDTAPPHDIPSSYVLSNDSSDKSSDFGPSGVSLFTPISPERSCADAGVPESYCVCYQHTTVATDAPVVRRAALFMKETLNSFVDEKLCETLVIKDVISAIKIEAGMSVQRGMHIADFGSWYEMGARARGAWEDYILLLKMTPGGGVFEARVRSREGKRTPELVGDIERTNMYGNSSYCVSKSFQKKYCLCKGFHKDYASKAFH